MKFSPNSVWENNRFPLKDNNGQGTMERKNDSGESESD